MLWEIIEKHGFFELCPLEINQLILHWFQWSFCLSQPSGKYLMAKLCTHIFAYWLIWNCLENCLLLFTDKQHLFLETKIIQAFVSILIKENKNSTDMENFIFLNISKLLLWIWNHHLSLSFNWKHDKVFHVCLFVSSFGKSVELGGRELWQIRVRSQGCRRLQKCSKKTKAAKSQNAVVTLHYQTHVLDWFASWKNNDSVNSIRYVSQKSTPGANATSKV